MGRRNVGSPGDPRGLFPAGLVPANTFQYVTILQGQPIQPGQPATVFGPLGVTTQIFNLELNRDVKQADVILFEGRDVIDLPTEGLAVEDGFLVVPDNVALVLNAGAEPLVGDGASLADEIAGLSDNVNDPGILEDAGQVNPRANPFTNRIPVTGSPGFVSYVAVDEYLFREVSVVTLLTGALGTGVSAQISANTFVARFAVVNVGDDEEEPRRIWRMSESWNVRTSGEVTETPQDVIGALSSAERAKLSVDVESNHLVYNLRDEEGLSSFGPNDVQRVTADAVRPALAAAKADPESDFFDENFQSFVVDYENGFGATNQVVDTEDETTTVAKTSQNLRLRLGKSSRFYTFFANNAVLLGRTRPVTPGVSAYATGPEQGIVVHDVSATAGSLITERSFLDPLWTQGSPAGGDPSFMAGEAVLRDEGFAVFFPLSPVRLEAPIEDNKVDMPADFFPIFVVFSRADEDNVFSAFESGDATGDPVFSLQFGIPEGGTLPLHVSGARFASFSGDGYAIEAIFGAVEGQVILPALEGDAGSADPSEFQIANTGALTFPVRSSSPSACVNGQGTAFLAFEYEDKVGLATSRSRRETATIVRDVVLRVGDEGNDDPGALPAASSPMLLCDVQTDNLLLFYGYKNSVLVKRIPASVVTQAVNPRAGGESNEAEIMSVLHGLGASVVHLGRSGGDSSLSADFDARAVRMPVQQESGDPASSYAAVQDGQGTLWTAVEANGNIVVKKSTDLGDVWSTVLDGNGALFPELGEDEETQLFSPSLFYDKVTDVVSVFFFLGSSLLVKDVPAAVLRSGGDVAGIKPTLLVGAYREDFEERGIRQASSARATTPPPELVPHRVAVVSTEAGYRRLYFKDQDDVLSSLMSPDDGLDWFAEAQYAALGAGAAG